MRAPGRAPDLSAPAAGTPLVSKPSSQASAISVVAPPTLAATPNRDLLDAFSELACPIRQVDTAKFKTWFGDSKIVTKDGSPRVIYHGTYARGIHYFSPSEAGTLGSGIYFLDKKKDALVYGDTAIAVFASIQNPWRITLDHESDAVAEEDFDNPAIEAVLSLPGGREIMEASKCREDCGYDIRLTEVLEELGFDGIIGTYPDGSQEIVVFDPRRVKLAKGNCGDFDPQNPDVRR